MAKSRATLTYEIAMAAGRDAANRNMKKEGRTVWSEEDYNLAVQEFERLWPLEVESD